MGERFRGPVGADRLKETLLAILGSMGETLVVIIQQLGKETGFAELCARVRHLKAAIPNVMRKPSPGEVSSRKELLPAEWLHELDSSESEKSSVNEASELQELLQDIQSYNSCHFGLSSVLQEPAESVWMDLGKYKVDIAVGQDRLLNTTRPHISSVTGTDPSIHQDYVRQLGEANELRYNGIQNERAQNDVSSTSTAGANCLSQFDERMAATDQNLEGKKADHKDKLSRLFGQGDEARTRMSDS